MSNYKKFFDAIDKNIPKPVFKKGDRIFFEKIKGINSAVSDGLKSEYDYGDNNMPNSQNLPVAGEVFFYPGGNTSQVKYVDRGASFLVFETVSGSMYKIGKKVDSLTKDSTLDDIKNGFNILTKHFLSINHAKPIK